MSDGGVRLRQPEYTGENRCLPCTAVNLAIGFLLAVATLALAVAGGYPTLAYPLAVGVFLAAAVLVFFRGYLVPGTPTLTKRYFPAWLLAWLGKSPAAESAGGLAAGSSGQDERETLQEDEVDPERTLVDAHVLEPCQNSEDLCLTGAFASAWREAIAGAGTEWDREQRFRAHLVDGEFDLDFQSRETDYRVATAAGREVGRWESEAAFVADVAAAPLLAERVDSWDRLTGQARGGLLNGLRLFIEVCPNCAAEVTMTTETVESCCSEHTVAALQCEDCGTRLFESQPL